MTSFTSAPNGREWTVTDGRVPLAVKQKWMLRNIGRHRDWNHVVIDTKVDGSLINRLLN